MSKLPSGALLWDSYPSSESIRAKKLGLSRNVAVKAAILGLGMQIFGLPILGLGLQIPEIPHADS